MLNTKTSARISTAAKIGAVGVLAVGLFASSPYTNEARAIDIAPTTTNASLVFSPTFFNGFSGSTQQAVVCAKNLSKATVQALFVFEDQDAGTNVLSESKQLPPGGRACSGFNDIQHDFEMLAYIVLNSPTECSQATEYPGKCKLVASLETNNWNDQGERTNLIHTEPVLVLGLPGSPRLTNLPQ